MMFGAISLMAARCVVDGINIIGAHAWLIIRVINNLAGAIMAVVGTEPLYLVLGSSQDPAARRCGVVLEVGDEGGA